jgi:Glyoxalase-like domain
MRHDFGAHAVAQARLTQIVVDCQHPAPLARFWAAVLDGFDVRGYDDAEVRGSRRTGSRRQEPGTSTC